MSEVSQSESERRSRRSRTRKALKPTSSATKTSPNSEQARSTSRLRRNATIYDAVAGRVTTSGFADAASSNRPSKYRDQLSHSTIPIGPGEALFKSSRAPDRFEEDDIYTAHRHLNPSSPNDQLPSSDLLKAIHTYTSDFYASSTKDKGQSDFRSMDETALLALGILLEETAGEILGETGDMVFVEGEAEHEIVDGNVVDNNINAQSTTRNRDPDIRKRNHQTQATHAQDQEQFQTQIRERPQRKERAARKRSYADMGDDY